MDFEVKPIPDGAKRGWTVRVNGEERQDVHSLELTHAQFGRLAFGLRPEGYDGWVFVETGGGGSVTLPWARTPKGEVLIGLRRESRKNMGGDRWCVIGGFKEPGESHREAQVREAQEESGLDATKAGELPGLPTNANRAFFVANPDAEEGVHAFDLQVPFSWLELAEPEHEVYTLLAGVEQANLPKPEQIRFFPWRMAVQVTADGLARAAIAQLLTSVL